MQAGKPRRNRARMPPPNGRISLPCVATCGRLGPFRTTACAKHGAAAEGHIMERLVALFTAATALGWLILVAVVLFFCRSQARALFDAAVAVANRGSEIKVGFVTIGQAVGKLKTPAPTDALTDDHLALIHRSWRVPKRDAEFGMRMFQIHVIVFGSSEALHRVEYVVYRLEKSYPNPVQIGGPLETNFELKELANGYSLLRAEAHVSGQQEPVRLSRFIDLTDQSPPLKGTYQTMVEQQAEPG
jgi:hypothetical protein